MQPQVPGEWLGSDGLINDEGRRMMAALIEKMPAGQHQLQNPQQGDPDVFAIYMGKAKVSAAVEIILIYNQRLYLTFRADQYWTGWHFPGTYIGSQESFVEALNRCALREIGIRVRIRGMIGTVNHPSSPRFHDIGCLFLCDPEDPDAVSHTFQGNPSWMAPAAIKEENLIAPHRPYLKMVLDHLGGATGFAPYVDIAK